MLHSESAQNNCPPAWPIQIVPPVPASAPSPTPSPAPRPDASSAKPPPVAAALLLRLAGPVRRSLFPVRPTLAATSYAAPPRRAATATAPAPRVPSASTACVSSALHDSAPWPAVDS